jgi:hypothetical protein
VCVCVCVEGACVSMWRVRPCVLASVRPSMRACVRKICLEREWWLQFQAYCMQRVHIHFGKMISLISRRTLFYLWKLDCPLTAHVMFSSMLYLVQWNVSIIKTSQLKPCKKLYSFSRKNVEFFVYCFIIVGKIINFNVMHSCGIWCWHACTLVPLHALMWDLKLTCLYSRSTTCTRVGFEVDVLVLSFHYMHSWGIWSWRACTLVPLHALMWDLKLTCLYSRSTTCTRVGFEVDVLVLSFTIYTMHLKKRWIFCQFWMIFPHLFQCVMEDHVNLVLFSTREPMGGGRCPSSSVNFYILTRD